MPIAVDPDTDTQVWRTALHLAAQLRLTADDAVYLELAQRKNLPLATLDHELRAAGTTLGVTLLGGN